MITSMKKMLTPLFLLIILNGYGQTYTHNATPKFQNLNFEDGISNLSVQSIEQDEQGFIWLATARCLNRYDGISFEHFFFEDNNDFSLNHNRTYKLHKNFNGQLFCSTANGVNMYDSNLEKMYRIKSNNERFLDFVDYKGKTYGTSVSGGLYVYWQEESAFTRVSQFDSTIVINSLISDEETGIWGKTDDSKNLMNFNPHTNILKKFPIPGNDEVYNIGDILKIDDILYIAGKSIKAFSLSSSAFIPLPAQYKKLEELKNCDFTFIKNIENGVLWIGTSTNGLFIFNPHLNQISNKTKANSNLRSNHLTTVFKDRDNNIWVGTFDQGVHVSFKQPNYFNFETQLDNRTENSFVTSIAADNNSNYYIGTRSDGLYVYNGGAEKRMRHLHKGNSFLKNNNIRTLYIDSKNQLWIGSAQNQFKTDLQFKHVTEIKIPKPNSGIISFCEQGGKIIAGSNLQGIFTFDYNGNILSQNKKYTNDIVDVIPFGNEEVLTSVLLEGVFLFDVNSNTFKNIKKVIPTEGYNLREVVTILLDSDSTLWMGTYDKGLYRYNFIDKNFRIYTENDGLPNNDIVCIEEDEDGYLWLATSYGLSRFDKNAEFINFFHNEGLYNLQFHRNSSTSSRNGLLFFGGNNGLTFFDPTLVGKFNYTDTPEITLKSISVKNKVIKPNDETGLLTQALDNSEEIILNHKQNVFTINYHGFDYIAADKIKYAYMLEGLDKKWTDAGKRTHANFSNLRPGTYTFKVKAQNNTGLWSEIKALKIFVKSSPFKTPIAYFIYLFVFATIIYFGFKLTLQAKLYRNKLETEQKERVRENEIAQMKMRFFTNISHEIRTPLTLIKGNTDLLSKHLTSSQIHLDSFKGLRHSTNRLLALVNQLLSFKSLENDALGLKVRNDDLLSITKNLIQSFQYVASVRKIKIGIDSDFDKLILPIDKDKYEKIVSNLLSNALKHVKENGKVHVRIEMLKMNEYKTYHRENKNISGTSFVKITVIDNGTGIPETDLPHVFNRYQQSETDKNKPDYSGTGIGLNFTKRLVELHRGAIIAQSTPNIETRFSFILSLDPEIYGNDFSESNELTQKKEILPVSTEGKTGSKQKNNLAVVLLVEDDLELNRFICSSLQNDFKVISSYNGNEGYSLAKNHLPDIIISDIMMPETNGYELCKLVREDDLISHIPIILLTAKADTESKISGYKYGADDYISKPFDLEILKIRIENLISLRKKLQQSYKQGILEEPDVEITNLFELNFVKQINTIVSAEYQSPQLNVNYLAEKMNMSRTNFYRKFMNIMDVSPKDFITKYRINKAIELIKEGNVNIGEISFICGFGSQSNFSVQFKKEKGESPLQYKKSLQHANNPTGLNSNNAS
nr:two-component regulator propeller domain-containing protein [uncultured Draconibacterium sp.]